MKPLNVRFKGKTKAAISNAAEKLEVPSSHIARAAINIGLKEIDKMHGKHKGEMDMAIYEYLNDNQ